MVLEEIYSLSKVYPIVTIIFGGIFFFLALKFAKKIFWVLAILALIVGIVLFFL